MNPTTQRDPASASSATTRGTWADKLLPFCGAAGGLAVLLAGAAIGPAGWERLFGREPGSLAWGPQLFRALLIWHGLLLLAFAARPRRNRRSDSTEGIAWRPSLDRRTIGLLAALSLVGLLLRLVRLDSCLWLDEVLTMVRFAQVPLGTVVTTFPDQNQHMLYSILAHLSLAVFGDSAWAFRVPAVVFGVLGIPMLFLLADRVVSRVEAWMASLLLTVSYHHIWFSQNARAYTGLLFFSMLTTWLFLIGLNARRREVEAGEIAAVDRSPAAGTVWMAYALATFAGWWMHLTMMFVTFAQGIVWLAALVRVIVRRGAGKTDPSWAGAANGWIPWSYLIAGSLTLQVYALSLPEFLRSAVDAGSLHSIWMEPWWIIRSFVDNLQVGFGGTVGLLLGGLLFGTGMLSLARRCLPLLAIFLLSTVSALWVMVALEHNLWPRFFFFAMGFMIIIVVRGAYVWGEIPARLISRSDRAALAVRFGTAAMLGLVVLSLLSLPRLYRYPKQDYESAKRFVLAERTDSDAVASTGLAGLTFQLYFAPDWPVVESVEQLQQLQRAHRRVWLIYTFPPHMMSTHSDIWQVIEAQGGAVKSFPGSLRGGEVYVSCLANRASSIADPQHE